MPWSVQAKAERGEGEDGANPVRKAINAKYAGLGGQGHEDAIVGCLQRLGAADV